MNIPEHIFKSYDIRGIYPSEFNEDSIVSIVKSIYKLIQDKKGTKEPLSIVLSCDMRISSPSLFETAMNTLVDIGANVIDGGILSTPSSYFTVFHYNYDGGIQITASHNPKEYNGMKIVMNSQDGLIKIGKTTGMEDIKRMATSGIEIPTDKKGTVIKKTGILEDEVNNALKITGFPKPKKFKIVADTANAMGSTYIDALFKVIQADLIRMNFELDGNFPVHQPDPLQHDTLVDLQKRVLTENADFGLAPDGDGDRLFFIDELGNVVPPSIITALVAKELLQKEENKNQKFLYDIRYIITPKKIIEENGGISVITKVGHAFITEGMHENNGIFAGESSGHYFFKETGNAESQIPVILMVLKAITDENKTLSQLVEELRRSFESGEINFRVSNAKDILEQLKERYKDGEVSTLDGIAISYPEWRFSLRTSNTEPLLRLNLESIDKQMLEDKKNEILGIINNIKNNA